MVINTIEILPGEHKKIDVNIARLPSHSTIDISIHVARASKPGPVLLLTAGMHGDEINGIEIVRRINERGWNIPTRGTIITIPIINIYGFIHFSRYVPDGKDVNRSFPGNKNGSLASRVAYYISKEILPIIDFGIDFHTGGAERTNYPQVRCNMNYEENVMLAEKFNAPYTIHSNLRPKSLRYAANKLGKKIIVFEGGESSRFDEFAIREGINGAVRVMRYFKMTKQRAIKAKHENKVIKHSSWVRAHSSGIFLAHVKAGQAIAKYQILGYLTDPFDEFRIVVKSPHAGYVIGLNNNPILHQGDAIMHIGVIK